MSASTGKRVVVLEGRVRGAGQSGKDTGELLAWNNHQFNTLQQAYGDKLVAQVAQSHHAAIAAVRDLVKTESISCQYTPVNGYIQASERLLAAEGKAFNAAGTQAEKVRILTSTSSRLGNPLQQHHISSSPALLYTICLLQSSPFTTLLP